MSSVTSSSFTRAAVSAMRALYPEELADRSWDNTGLLLEATEEASQKAGAQNRILLAIDLTTAVADEAIDKKVSLVVAYHGIIFRAIKSITLSNPQQRSLSRLAAAGISVYSPHTAVDAASGGNADWLASTLTSKGASDQNAALSRATPVKVSFKTNASAYRGFEFPQRGIEIGPNEQDRIGATLEPHQVSAIIPSGRPGSAPEGTKVEGMGRILDFDRPQSLVSLLQSLASALGEPEALNVALTRDSRSGFSEIDNIKRVGVCAGSGGSIVSKARPPVDLIVTGEMSHHEALACVEAGQAVVCLGHSNSERQYLRAVMKPKLEEALRTSAAVPEAKDAEVLVSVNDSDPFLSFVRTERHPAS